MAFNSTLAIALTDCGSQVDGASLSTTTKPTLVQATTEWNRCYGKIVTRLRKNGISATFTSGSASEYWVQQVEGLMTSGRVLILKGAQGNQAQGTTGSGGDTTADRLLAEAEAMLAELDNDRRARLALIAGGGAASNLPTSGFASSDWTDGRDTTVDVTYGGDNVLYIPSVPVVQDGEGF